MRDTSRLLPFSKPMEYVRLKAETQVHPLWLESFPKTAELIALITFDGM